MKNQKTKQSQSNRVFDPAKADFTLPPSRDNATTSVHVLHPDCPAPPRSGMLCTASKTTRLRTAQTGDPFTNQARVPRTPTARS